ncbi:MAG: phosphoribosylanthranilate isomerase [bacterium]
MPVKIKICGITNSEDATWAVNLGAHFLGFNFCAESPRKVSEKNAKEIISKLPPFISTVGVFVNADMPYLVSVVKKTGIVYAQLHGDESPEYIDQVKDSGVKVIKVFRIKHEFDLDTMTPFIENADYFLLDTYHPELPGGTGESFNWELAQKVRDRFKKPFFLAGGLTAENVAYAVEQVLPFGVDVCSGVEKSPRRKDYNKMKQVILSV